jgi:hypothetical protein
MDGACERRKSPAPIGWIARCDPGDRLPEAVRRGAADQAAIQALGMVFDEPEYRVQHRHDRADHVGQNYGQSTHRLQGRSRAVRISGEKLGMTQAGRGLASLGQSGPDLVTGDPQVMTHPQGPWRR